MPQKLQNLGHSAGNLAKEAATPSVGRVALPGHYAIAMFKDVSHVYYLTAVGGGGRTNDTLHTDATAVKDWEKFRFINGGPSDPFAIQTINGHFLTAVDGGGHTANAITTAASQVSSRELFNLRPQSGSGFSPHFSIQTPKGTFLTAVGHGGQNTPDAIHSDATAAQDWEMFDFLKIGDPGTNRTYSLEALSFSGASLGYLNATDGGRRSDSAALTLQPGPSYMLTFTLVQQPDGTHAFKTASGYYVTANAAGLPGARFRTDTPQVNNWEKFTIIPDENDCTYRIKTSSGAYVTAAVGHPPDPQYVVDCAPAVADAIRWRLWVVSF
jgi:hypothetical protein